MGHRMHRRPSWNYCTYRLISLAFISGSIMLYASYLCLSPIYCNVECFHFFMAANIDFVWSRFEASLQLACDVLSTCMRPGLQPGLQLARIMECGLKSLTITQGHSTWHLWVWRVAYLLVFHCNYVSISYRFWDIQRQIMAWSWNAG